ncbi:hypothetical protein KSP39_PZI009504 [Platanthera zijinensis]|uniref:Uncharacterized protein n=1 Tax=Platanthera zijinensis TaxID=2320716 RepID=A0AAP0BL74_9ASPA
MTMSNRDNVKEGLTERGTSKAGGLSQTNPSWRRRRSTRAGRERGDAPASAILPPPLLATPPLAPPHFGRHPPTTRASNRNILPPAAAAQRRQRPPPGSPRSSSSRLPPPSSGITRSIRHDSICGSR